MLKKQKEAFQSRPLESRVFMIVLFVGCLTALMSAIFTAIEGLGVGATLSTIASFVALVMVSVVAIVFKKESVCHILLFIVLNFLLLPVAFFFCGGIKSGMTLYFLTALYVIVPTISRRVLRAVMYLSSVIVLATVIELSYYVFPELVTDVSDSAWRTDVFMSFLLNAFCIYMVSSLTVKAYREEREEKERLARQMEQLAVHDELTGLYNRRELFRFLEEDVMGAGTDDLHCMFIFDVDDFKKTNDTYGHVFGDKVLSEVAGCLRKAALSPDNGEIAARYGGEEFIGVFHDADFETSYARAEKIRQEVEALRFYENPEFRVTISGGVDRCNGMRPRYALRQVDDLLYLAKTTGKNQITRKF